MVQEDLLNKIEEWAREGLVSPEQAEALKQREMETAVPVTARRVNPNEIFVYLGSIVIFLALAFLLGSNWTVLGSAGRILSVLVPTVLLLALGWWLRGSESTRLRRGAQALLLGGCLLSALSFGVILDELDLIGDESLLVLVSALLATGVAGGVFVLVPTVAQSVALHLCGSVALIAFNTWFASFFGVRDVFYPMLVVVASCLVVGGLWLALAGWQQAKGRQSLVTVSRIFGALTILGGTFIAAVGYFEPYTREALSWRHLGLILVALLASISFIAAAVAKQSQIYLYSGAAFLLFLITYVNLEFFADTVGMPVSLFIIGVLLIGLGLGTERIRKRIRASP